MSERHPFIVHLESLHQHDDRAALATLRRGLAQQTAMFPIVARFFPVERNAALERAFLIVAPLFALHPGAGGVSLARAMRRAATESPSIEGRFSALLDAEVEDLAVHLRNAISLVRARDIAVDWDDLFRAVRYWDDDERRQQRRWARDYWAAAPLSEG